MLDTLTRYLVGIPDSASRYALRFVIAPITDRMSSQSLTSSGLAINGAGAAFPKIGAAPFYACVQGDLVLVAAGTALPALTGINVPAGFFGVACYFVDNAGTVTVMGGTPSAALSGVNWPQFPVGKALIGLLIITGAGAFTGGTTALDAGSTIFISPVGAFDPTALV